MDKKQQLIFVLYVHSKLEEFPIHMECTDFLTTLLHLRELTFQNFFHKEQQQLWLKQ